LCADAFTLPLPGEWLLFDAPTSGQEHAAHP
jgi:hypothetical protein